MRLRVTFAFFILLDCAVNIHMAQAQDKIRLGLSSATAMNTTNWVAEERALFRKYGLDAEVIITGQGGVPGLGALLAGDIQLLSGSGDLMIASALRGGDSVMIAGMVNKGLQRILVRPDIKTPADLKGKRIGVTRIGAISHVVLLMMLPRWKMSVNDIQVVQAGSSPNMLASLEKGGIDAAVMSIPTMFVAEDRGYRVLLDMADTDIYYLHSILGTTRAYIKSNRDKVLRFLKAITEGLAYVKQHPKESATIVKKKLRISGAEQERNLDRSIELLSAKYYEQIPYISQRGVETILSHLEKESPKAKSADPKSFYDDSFLHEIEASGFVKSLYQK
ncbi:MAG TPA: ABC transporter substrate-binding protein [Methylomirabilota bacterium]|nr:ABC transporter substrate-binding protein [Methylomirabilota bacterium]